MKLRLVTLSLSLILLYQGNSYAQFFGLTLKKKLPSAPAITSSVKSLVRETNDPIAEFYPRVSPDGQFLLFHVRDDHKPVGERFSIIKKTINSPSRNPIVAAGSSPSWLPDGSGIIFSYRMPAKPVIVKTNSSGVGLNYVSQTAMGEDDWGPVMSKDAKRVFFTTLIGGKRMICSMDVKGGDFTVITEGDYVNIHPDGKKIVYSRKIGKFFQIFENDLESGQTTQYSSGDFNNIFPAYSFDGKWLAFSSNRGNKKEDPHIYIMRTDGSDLKQLTSGETEEGHPSWAPNNDIYFYSNADRNWDIWKATPILE